MSAPKEQVKSMFDEISPRYDLLNRLLSFGIDRYWRNRLIREIRNRFPGSCAHLRILDVATGTGDLAIAAAELHPSRIDGLDISANMMAIAQKKIKTKGLINLIRFHEGEAENIPFDTNRYDVAMVAFGVRNFHDLLAGLSEMNRVLKPGALLLILEFSQPQSFPLKPLYQLYSTIIPLFGRMVSHHRHAYTYLPETVARFPYGETFLTILRNAGWQNPTQIPLSGGIATIYSAEK